MLPLHIGVFAAAALAAGSIRHNAWRGWLILILSVLGLFWLQPATSIRQLDFWLPVLTIALTVFVWLAVRRERPHWPRVVQTLAVIAGIVVALAATRYVDALCCLTASRPPQLLPILLVLGAVVSVQAGLARVAPRLRWLAMALVLLLIGLLVVLKTPQFALATSAGLRALTGQATDQASALDIRWLGISYIAFRLIHVLRDYQNGVLPEVDLPEFVSYVLFFPALTAGPIDRVEQFAADLRAPFALSPAGFFAGVGRVLVGMFKKFVIADALALIALTDLRAAQTGSALWLWVMLYAYAFRLYLDFAGLSDIAIGLGQLAGITLPENFDRPYRQPHLTAFWNSWHMTLANWFRAYYFNPVSRSLRSRARAASPAAIIAFSQLTTMLLIGLWHGITWNYAIWGLWHGVGLFAHNRWAAITRAQARSLESRPRLNRLVILATTLLTFHYVALGWVWFALSEPGLAASVFARLFGG